jgi:hypothetical protein
VRRDAQRFHQAERIFQVMSLVQNLAS